ncbi:MAG: type II secretion system protein [Bdellovibrionota bacterium]
MIDLQWKNEKGFSLLAVLFAVSVLGIFISAFSTMTNHSQRVEQSLKFTFDRDAIKSRIDTTMDCMNTLFPGKKSGKIGKLPGVCKSKSIELKDQFGNDLFPKDSLGNYELKAVCSVSGLDIKLAKQANSVFGGYAEDPLRKDAKKGSHYDFSHPESQLHNLMFRPCRRWFSGSTMVKVKVLDPSKPKTMISKFCPKSMRVVGFRYDSRKDDHINDMYCDY